CGVFVDNFLKRPYLVQRDVRINGENCIADTGCQNYGVAGRPDEDASSARRILRFRDQNLHARWLIDAVILNVSHEPDDGQPVYLLTSGRRTIDRDLLAYRVLAGKVLLRKRFINDTNMLNVLVILSGKEATLCQADSHRDHGVRRDTRHVGRRIATRLRKRPSTDGI